MSLRVACVRLRDFAAWALRRHDPTLAGVSLVVGGIPPERGIVCCLSPEARRDGLRPGMTLAAAQAVLPAARFFRADADLDRRETAALRDLLGSFTPGVESVSPDAGGARHYFLDTRGLGRLHATEAAFAERVRAAVQAIGYPATVGVGAGKFTAEVAAREAPRGVRIVPPGGESAFLAPLALSHLPGDDAFLDSLQALGITTLGALARLPAETIGSRFGARGLALHALARGDDPSPFVAAPGDEPPQVTADLDDPTDDLDLLTFHLKRAVDTLVLRLGERGLATAAVAATLRLEGHERRRVEAHAVRPTVAARLLVDLLRLAIQREAPPGRIAGFTLIASETAPARAEQLLLFARQRASADRPAVEAALARVRALVGPEGMVSPRPGDSHRPEEQVRFEPYAGLPEPAVAATPAPSRRRRPAAARPPLFGGLPARLLPRPIPAEVEAVGDRLTYLAAETIRGRVVTTSGPHVVEGEWWGNAYEREYFAVTLGGSRGRYWVFRNRLDGSWCLHGIFD